MTFEKSNFTEISQYISTMLADYFGDSPRSTNILYKKPFIDIMVDIEKELIQNN